MYGNDVSNIQRISSHTNMIRNNTVCRPVSVYNGSFNTEQGSPAVNRLSHFATHPFSSLSEQNMQFQDPFKFELYNKMNHAVNL